MLYYVCTLVGRVYLDLIQSHHDKVAMRIFSLHPSSSKRIAPRESGSRDLSGASFKGVVTCGGRSARLVFYFGPLWDNCTRRYILCPGQLLIHRIMFGFLCFFLLCISSHVLLVDGTLANALLTPSACGVCGVLLLLPATCRACAKWNPEFHVVDSTSQMIDLTSQALCNLRVSNEEAR